MGYTLFKCFLADLPEELKKLLKKFKKKNDGEFVKGWGGIWSWGSVKHVKAQVLSFHNDQGTLHLTVLFVNLSVVYFDRCTLYF